MSSAPPIAASSSATPSGRWPLAPKKLILTLWVFSRMNTSSTISTIAPAISEPNAIPVLVRGIVADAGSLGVARERPPPTSAVGPVAGAADGSLAGATGSRS